MAEKKPSFRKFLAPDRFRLPSSRPLLAVAFTVLLFSPPGCAVTRPIVDTAGDAALTALPLPVEKMVAEVACGEHLDRHDHADRDVLSREVAEFQVLTERTLVSRAEIMKHAMALREKAAGGKPLSGDDLERLERLMTEHLALREELFAVAEAHECWTGRAGEELVRLDGGDRIRLKGVMLSLAAALMLYDNYLMALSLYQEDHKLRKLLNTSSPAGGVDYGELHRISLSYASPANRSRMRKGIGYYEGKREVLRDSAGRDEELSYLDLLINQSPSYNMTRRSSPLYGLGRKIGLYSTVGADTLGVLGGEGMNLTSMLFGNLIGLVESRRGKLHGRKNVTDHLGRILRPGDILLEKTPFRLTDKFIPGHWGHAAVWIGTEEDMRRMGIWEHRDVAVRHDEIRSGRLVVEALRSGVEMNTLAHFMNIDDLAVLRPVMTDEAGPEAVVRRALRQVGKPYDFNFDVETSARIVCSELVYHTHTDIDWATEKRLGRATISPDNVAIRAIRGGPLQVMALYHDGVLVEEDVPTLFAALLGEADHPLP